MSHCQVRILFVALLAFSQSVFCQHDVICIPINVLKRILAQNPGMTIVWADIKGGIIPQISKEKCPGPFPMNQVFSAVGEPSCEGTVTADILNIRSQPSTSSKIVGKLSKGLKATFSERVGGTNVRGNTGWFRTAHGFVSAYYINLIDPRPSWCYK